MLSRQETASSSHSVANVRAVPAASKAQTGPAGGEAQCPAHSGGGTPSLTRGRVRSVGTFISEPSSITSFLMPMCAGRKNGKLADWAVCATVTNKMGKIN